jgi:predicted nucleic acid-binding protein
MPTICFDSSVYIKRKPPLSLKGFVLSVVVLQELAAGATDQSRIKLMEATYKAFRNEGKLLVPNDEDWWQAGRILSALSRGLRSPKDGRIPKQQSGLIHRIVRDVLIARSVKRAGALLVTNNIDDFILIRPYCSVRVISDSDYFE